MSVENQERWSIKGEFVEACNCSAPCQCLWNEAPDDDECTAALFWHIDEGEYEGVDLSGLTAGALVYDQGILFEGDWDLVVLVDEQATDAQAAALGDIFMGRAGGVMGAVAELVDEVKDTVVVPISYSKQNGHLSVAAGDVVAIEADAIEGFEEVPGEVSPHPLTPPSMTASTGKSTTATVSFNDEFSWDVSGNNSYFGEFEYEG
ncbi:hypothetical protein C2R22_15035 [Salinigranum rubrum]|uniref:DUF1326 domain-containing protein n=1 Tax=Salinigranum rubrum TaxID=755307 RepID=A0A2I8VLH5_9EURY|nr:DUF1326 domain-containing protein [Salinigranum rubrum]AUV82790.1 hypothetical protein C2R22_15035 [Salinigranum rubrum]